jgi:hypothetical protein
MTEREIEIHKLKDLNKTKVEQNSKMNEKILRSLIWKHYENEIILVLLKLPNCFFKTF